MTSEIIKIRVFDTDSPAGRMQSVPAEVYGELAIHLSTSGDRWAVTHILSGYEVASTCDYELAEKIVAELANLDWNFTEPVSMPANTRVGAEMFLRQLARENPDLRSSAQVRS